MTEIEGILEKQPSGRWAIWRPDREPVEISSGELFRVYASPAPAKTMAAAIPNMTRIAIFSYWTMEVRTHDIMPVSAQGSEFTYVAQDANLPGPFGSKRWGVKNT
jgi:hypothetical protein